MTNKKIEKVLIDSAIMAKNTAYAPYSKFKVGAAILDEKGEIHSGCNVENAAYPLGACAEAAAISHMVLSGSGLIKKMMLVSSGEQMVTPCGGCRQKIKEFSDKNTLIQVWHNKTITSFSIEELLPQSFSEKHLPK